MATGISVANVANPVLNWLRGVAPPAIPGLFVQLHSGDPGAAGTANVSTTTTRRQATMNAASGGAITLSSMSGTYTMVSTHTLTHISIWTASSGGSFLHSMPLASSQLVNSGDTYSIISLVLSQSPLAA